MFRGVISESARPGDATRSSATTCAESHAAAAAVHYNVPFLQVRAEWQKIRSCTAMNGMMYPHGIQLLIV